jgi:hypothetical protein
VQHPLYLLNARKTNINIKCVRRTGHSVGRLHSILYVFIKCHYVVSTAITGRPLYASAPRPPLSRPLPIAKDEERQWCWRCLDSSTWREKAIAMSLGLILCSMDTSCTNNNNSTEFAWWWIYYFKWLLLQSIYRLNRTVRTHKPIKIARGNVNC